ncbi:TolC family outer membrane protein [Sphingopyxis granuli]|uniref:Type I secretion outer membrane protein, TolC n=1 Tax=Sphingopyxis granuli TaxID=267128 RepID=A0AA86GTF2_9SPHN|nr:TolC family outer membrane protein [Sphingopyxis granuli]AMG76520.1 Type I secretion outer membrane protein, TolC [Sphingopyxis granuli]
MSKGFLKWSFVAFPLVAAGPAYGETLRQALIYAYRTNPSLTAARAGLRATDEGVPIAKAAGRPTLSATADYQEFVLRSANSFSAPLRAANANANLSFPLYQGGRVKNSIRAADARVESGRANLRFTEADVFTAIVSVYMDVMRDAAIVELNHRNVAVLETNLQASRDRFEVGDLTRTDVAQSEARLAVAQGQLETALAQLDTSLENYLRFVGLPARNLEQPPALPGLPRTPAEAVAIAIESNPQLLAASADAKAARYDVRVAAASRLPRLSAVASSGYNNYLGSLTSSLPGRVFQQAQTTATIGLSATIPLYQGGLPAAEVRRATALESQALEQTIFVERRVVAEARAAYSRYQATQAVIRSSKAAITANELALEGVRAENSVGTRNVLDVLNAEQELLNSRVQLVTAERDAYVAGFTLLAAMGRAEARDIDLFGGTLFEPGFSRKSTPGPVPPRIDSDPAPGGRIEFVPAPAEQHLDDNARSSATYPAVDEARSTDRGASNP